jgi:hypothetical protein
MSHADSKNNFVMLYKVAGTEPYKESGSYCLPAEFVLDELLTKKTFVSDPTFTPQEKPFILAGPEFNTIK